MPAEELPFKPTPAFGEYKHFLEHAIAHPAKANTKLLEFLVEKFTKEGDTVLDPMAGSGSTGVVAALHGRNAVQVELEPKFYGWMEKAKENVEKHPTLTPKGWIKNICGDARRLSELLSQADAVITSPPYLRSANSGAGINRQREGDVKIGCSTVGRTVEHPNAVDNLKDYGSIDTVITSPPYADAKRGGHADREKMAERWDEAFKEKGEAWNSWGKTWKTPGRLRGFEALRSGYSESQDNIGNLPFVDAVITSPPFAGTSGGKGERSRKPIDEKYPGLFERCIGGNKGALSNNPDNIDNLPYVDTVITSPPYERQLHDSREKRAAGAWKNSELDVEKNLPMGYSENPENIGNLRKETYLEAMLKVYGEMYKVLKPGGRAIVIVKPFIRNKRVVDLPLHTFLLMSRVGFVLEKVYKLRLRQQSFWRILYSRKYPDTPKISHEYVLVCMKPL